MGKVENIVGNGEIARYEQFLFFPQCFQKLSVVDASKGVSLKKRVNKYIYSYIEFGNRFAFHGNSRIRKRTFFYLPKIGRSNYNFHLSVFQAMAYKYCSYSAKTVCIINSLPNIPNF